MEFVKPVDFDLFQEDLDFLTICEKHYNRKIKIGCSPQQARFFLPNGLKTEIVATANLREWRTILKARTPKAAHPQIRSLMNVLLEDLKAKIPIIFDDIGEIS